MIIKISLTEDDIDGIILLRRLAPKGSKVAIRIDTSIMNVSTGVETEE